MTILYHFSGNASPKAQCLLMLSNGISLSRTTFTFLDTERWPTVRMSYYAYQTKANEFLRLFQYSNRWCLFYFWFYSTFISVRIFFGHPVYKTALNIGTSFKINYKKCCLIQAVYNVTKKNAYRDKSWIK